jgi:16S rRNA (adenine1518-N6/adenine1519-N6)-dimethyltransferase
MKLSEMKQLLAAEEIRLTKSLGQNFLHGDNQLQRMVAAAELKASDQVLEIGPGLGPLTELLIAKAGAVFAIEKDRRLMQVLRRRFPWACQQAYDRREPARSFGGDANLPEAGRVALPGGANGESDRATRSNLSLVHGDALKLLQRQPRDWSNWKLVANLPYSVASPILVELAQAHGPPERLVVTVQREVAQRLVAKAGDKDYGLLTLLIQLRYQPGGLFKIPAGCFFPPPAVDSACVTLVRRSGQLLDEEQARRFTRIVKRAFSQRRKMMFKLLKEDWPEETLAGAFERVKVPRQIRAETVSLAQFTELARIVNTESA